MRRALWITVCLWASVLPAILAQEPVGAEFQVNTHTTTDQLRPAVAVDATAGRFVVVWQSFFQDGSGYAVIGRQYSGSGAPAGPEFLVNEATNGDQRGASVGMRPDGWFVVVWTTGPSGVREVRGRLFEADGSAAGSEFQVNTFSAFGQENGAVAVDTAGNFVVVWQSDRQDGSGWGVFGQRYDPEGGRVGPELRVNVETTGDQVAPAVAADMTGGFVVVWQTDGQDGDAGAIVARRYDATGSPLGPEFRVNDYNTGAQQQPTVAALAGGGFVVAWESEEQDGSNRGVFGRLVDGTGALIGTDFRVNAYTTSLQGGPAVVSDAGGAFVVVWDSWDQDGSSYGVFGQRYNPSGAPLGPEFRVNTTTGGIQRLPGVGAAANGNFVVAWTGFDSDYEGIFAQRYGDLIYRDGFESGDLSRWSTAATGGGDLAVDASAALAGSSQGLRVVVDDPAALYVQDDSPVGESRYRARFYFDPNDFDPGEGLGHFRTRILTLLAENPALRLAAVVLKRRDGIYSVMARARQDDGSRVDTGFFPLADGPHWIELDWLGSTGDGALDGAFQLWIDATPLAALSGLDHFLGRVDSVRLGALSVKPGAMGTLYFDELESRRSLYVGSLD